MPTGKEMAFNAMAQLLMNNLPPEVLETVGQIGQTVAAFKAQLDRVEANQLAIMAKLEIQQTDVLQPANGATENDRPIGDRQHVADGSEYGGHQQS